MSKDFKYDDNGDLVLQNGQPVWVDGLEELTQALTALLTTPYGSFLDTEFGIDMSFIIGGWDENAARQAVTDAVMQDKRVIEVKDIDIQPDYDSGIAFINLSLATTLGDINFGKEVPLNATN